MTDSPDHAERLDIYDDVGRHLGVKDRRAVHRDGDWHRVFHCLVVAQRPETGPVAVLQLRSPAKSAFPGLLDLSAAGHLAAGESPVDGVRELHEELGIAARPAALVPLGVRLLADESGEGRINKERTHVFLLRDDRPVTDYRPDDREVAGVFEIGLDDGLRLFREPHLRIEGRGVELVGDRWGPATRTIARHDLVPNDSYWITLLVMAQRYLAGHTPLAV